MFFFLLRIRQVPLYVCYTTDVCERLRSLTGGEGLELLLQGDGGVVGTEHLGGQAVHQLL